MASGMAHARIGGGVGAGAGVVDAVGDFLFDFLGEDFLELLGHDARACGVGGVGSLGHGDGGSLALVVCDGDGLEWLVVLWGLFGGVVDGALGFGCGGFV